MQLLRLFLHCAPRLFSLQHQWWEYEIRNERGLQARHYFCRCGYQSPFEDTAQVLAEFE